MMTDLDRESGFDATATIMAINIVQKAIVLQITIATQIIITQITITVNLPNLDHHPLHLESTVEERDTVKEKGEILDLNFRDIVVTEWRMVVIVTNSPLIHNQTVTTTEATNTETFEHIRRANGIVIQIGIQIAIRMGSACLMIAAGFAAVEGI